MSLPQTVIHLRKQTHPLLHASGRAARHQVRQRLSQQTSLPQTVMHLRKQARQQLHAGGQAAMHQVRQSLSQQTSFPQTLIYLRKQTHPPLHASAPHPVHPQAALGAVGLQASLINDIINDIDIKYNNMQRKAYP